MSRKPRRPFEEKLKVYPASYARLLLSIPENDEGLRVNLISKEEAHQTRLKMYNFIRFVARHPEDAKAQFGSRAQRLTIKQRENSLIFVLRGHNIQTAGLDVALEELEREGKLVEYTINEPRVQTRTTTDENARARLGEESLDEAIANMDHSKAFEPKYKGPSESEAYGRFFKPSKINED